MPFTHSKNSHPLSYGQKSPRVFLLLLIALSLLQGIMLCVILLQQKTDSHTEFRHQQTDPCIRQFESDPGLNRQEDRRDCLTRPIRISQKA